MKNKTRKFYPRNFTTCTVIYSLLAGSVALAQDDVTTAGGNAGGPGGSVAYSIGQVFYSSHAGTNGSENQGMQQLYVENALPVTLVSFDAVSRGKEGILLRWVTSFELHNEYFVVEKSLDGRHFTALAKVKGKGDSNSQTSYESFDYFPAAGNNYYRLKQVDTDGTFAYSRIRVINSTEGSSQLAVYPNPTSGSLHINTIGANTGQLTFRITDMGGKLLDTKRFSGNSPELDVSNLSPASYLLTILDSDHVVKTVKIVKN